MSKAAFPNMLLCAPGDRSGFICRVSAERPPVSRRVPRGFSPKLWSLQPFQEAEKPPQSFSRFLFHTQGRASASEALLLPDVSSGSMEEHLSPKLFLLPTDWKDSGKRKIPTTIKNRGEGDEQVLGEIFTGHRNTAKGRVHISLKPKRPKLVRGERKELFSAHTCPSLIPPTMGNGSTWLADQTENGTRVTAQGVQHHLHKMLQPLVLQTPNTRSSMQRKPHGQGQWCHLLCSGSQPQHIRPKGK